MSPTQQKALEEIRKLVELYNEKTAGLSTKPNERKALFSEEDVVQHFIRPLLTALGWPTNNPDLFRYEKHTVAGRPDLTLIIPELNNSRIYTEAKRFGVIADAAEARTTYDGVLLPGQLSLPGMAVDRTKEEQQAINYAFENNGQWAILTNFEKLRLFNARRDWLVFSFETPSAYLKNFDDLWELSYGRILEGSLDELSNRRYREDVDQGYLAFINQWREKLAQNILDHLDKNAWARKHQGELDLDLLRSVVQRVLDRLVVVRFAEDHYVIPANTLEQMQQSAKHTYGFSLNDLINRLYRRFDEKHNSALFAPDYADEAYFSDEVLDELITKLYEARYRAMTPDIMGNTYEQYLGKTLVRVNGSIKTADNLETRKKQGSYYTPQVIVRYLVDQSLGKVLEGKTYREIGDVRVLDPACGSGSFLIYAYEVLATFYRSEIRRLAAEMMQQSEELAKKGESPLLIEGMLRALDTEIAELRKYPRIIVEKHLYGVDLDPQAAEIATVNLIMRAMADLRREKQTEVLPLILNQNVKVGNSLIGAGASDPRYAEGTAGLVLHRLPDLRRRFAASDHQSKEHRNIAHELQSLTDQANAELNKALEPYFEAVSARRPFNWVMEFPEVFLDENGQHKGDEAGFTVIIGNPPWEIVKPDLREFYAQFDPDIESRYTREQAEKRITELSAEDPTRATLFGLQSKRTEENARYYRASSDYSKQGRGDTATHKLFIERVYGLLRDGGYLGYVVPSGIYTDLGTKELREMLLNEGSIQYLFSFSNERFFFPGVDHRFKFTMLGAQKGVQSDGFWAAFRFNPRVAVRPDELPNFLAEPSNLTYMTFQSIQRFSPDNLNILEFPTQKDLDIADRIYTNRPLLGTALQDSWNVKFTREFDKTNDRELFNKQNVGLPVYEGENLGFYGEVLRPPTVWIDTEKGRKKLLSSLERQVSENTIIPLDYEHYRFGFRRIARATDIRTLIVSYLPKQSFAMYTLTTTVQHKLENGKFIPYLSKPQEMYLYSCMASFVLDYVIRFQVSSSVAMFNAYSLPVSRLTQGNRYFDEIVNRAARLICTRSEFAGLWQEVMGSAWDESCGVTDLNQRLVLRNEIDALVAHLYGLSREDFAHILGTFPLVFPETGEGQAKKEALLGVYDAFGEIVKGF